MVTTPRQALWLTVPDWAWGNSMEMSKPWRQLPGWGSRSPQPWPAGGSLKPPSVSLGISSGKMEPWEILSKAGLSVATSLPRWDYH